MDRKWSRNTNNKSLILPLIIIIVLNYVPTKKSIYTSPSRENAKHNPVSRSTQKFKICLSLLLKTINFDFQIIHTSS